MESTTHRLATAISLCLITALVGCVAEKDHGTHFGLDEHKKSSFALGSLNSSANDGASLGKIENFEWDLRNKEAHRNDAKGKLCVAPGFWVGCAPPPKLTDPSCR